MGRSIASRWRSEGVPEGNEGKRVSSGYNRRRRLATRSSGKQQAERTAVRAAPIVCPEESPRCARRRIPLPHWHADSPKGCRGRAESPFARSTQRIPLWWGLTRRLRRGLGLAVPWGAHTFLSVAKEKCAKESQRHGDSGKKPFIAHFDSGSSQCRAQHSWTSSRMTYRARSELTSFPLSKWARPFSLRCLSPLCSPAVGVGQAYPLRVGMLRCGLDILQRDKWAVLFQVAGACYPLQVGCSVLGYFAAQKASVVSNPRWPF